ncbi:hypothetical protein BDC45DRAFT_569209 [Circinella umbellata]|nr:hypothetical protein BDC45DRAFT_569209 [Circinella umbellata]
MYYDETDKNLASSEETGVKSKFDDFSLRSLDDVKAIESDNVFNITVERQVVTDRLSRDMINCVPFINLLTFTLFTELTMGALANNSIKYMDIKGARYCDTMEVRVYGFVVLRYRPDNPGYSCSFVILIVLAEPYRQQDKPASGNATCKKGLDHSRTPSGMYLSILKLLIPPDDSDDENHQ